MSWKELTALPTLQVLPSEAWGQDGGAKSGVGLDGSGGAAPLPRHSGSSPWAGVGSLPAVPSGSPLSLRGQPGQWAGKLSLAQAPPSREASGDFQAAFYGAERGLETRQRFLETMQGVLLTHAPRRIAGVAWRSPSPRTPGRAGYTVRGASLAQRLRALGTLGEPSFHINSRGALWGVSDQSWGAALPAGSPEDAPSPSPDRARTTWT